MGTDEQDLRHLKTRLERPEHLVVQVVCWTASLALALGSVLAYLPVTEGADEQDVMPRLLTAGVHSLAFRDNDGNSDGFAITSGIGFLGLILVAGLTIWLMLLIAGGSATDHTGRWLTILTILLVIGTTIAGIFALVGLSSDEIDVGWGVVVFAAGVGLCLLLTRSSLRGWWDPMRGAQRPRFGRW